MIEIYGIPETLHNCWGCVQSRKLLDRLGIEYTFYPVLVKSDNDLGFDYDRARIQELAKRKRQKGLGFTYPQIFKDGIPIGGFMELKLILGED